jgi:autotransporter-associated beta strand protein
MVRRGIFLAVVGVVALMLRPACGAPASNWVFYGADGTLQYQTTATGDKFLDYSGVGYQGGTQNIPLVPTVLTLTPTGTSADDTTRIQQAIAQVAAMPTVNGFHGAIQFAPGTYNIGSSINLSSSGIVLRGAGQGPTGTLFHATGNTDGLSNYDVIVAAPSGSTSFSRGNNPSLTITDQYVPVGATSFNVSATTGLKVGDKIVVQRPSTQQWINDIGMGAALPPAGIGAEAWSPSSSFMQADRTITAISGNKITVNAGLTTAIDSRTINGVANAYGGGTVWEYTTNRVSNIGIENIRFDTIATSSTDMNHAGRPISFSGVSNSWVRNTTALDFYNGIFFGSKSEYNTSQDNEFRDPAGDTHSGGHALAGQFDLIQRDTTFNAHAPFVTQDSNTVGPDVFVFGTANGSLQSVGPHQRWASGVLWDNIKVTNGTSGSGGIELVNRGNFGSGQGWAGANMVTWNTNSPWIDVEAPATAQQWAVGAISPDRRVHFNGAEGTYDSFGTRVSLNSLYISQLKQALGPQPIATATHLFSVGPNTNFVGPSITPFIDPGWKAIAESADLPGAGSIVGFDNATANARRAATIQYSLTSPEKVVAATLTMTLKAISTVATTDSFFLNSPGMQLDYDMLGLLPWSAGQVRTVSIDLSDIYGPLLGPLQNDALNAGKFNLFWNGNVNVDFAQLSLSTTGLGAAAASRIWNGGSATDNNALTAANWTTSVAPKVGDTLVFDGSTRLAPNNDLPADTILGGITFNSTAGAFTLSGNAITLSGNITDNAAAPQTINLSIRPDAIRTVSVASGGTLTIGGSVTGSNGIIKAGAGTLVLAGSNTFTGGLIINGGLVQLANAGALNSASPMSVLFGPAAVAASTLQLNGNNLTITNLNTTGTFSATIVENGTATANLLTLNTTATNNFAGTLRDGAPAGGTFGAMSLTLTGGGSLTLSGPNSYTGITRILGSTITAAAANSFAGLSGQVRFGSITVDGTTFGGTFHVTDPGGNHVVVAAGTQNKFTTVGQSGVTGAFNVDYGVTLQIGALDGNGLPTSTVAALQTAGTGPDGNTTGGSFIKQGAGTLRIVSQNSQQDTNFQLQGGTVDLWHARGLGGADSTAVQLNMSDATTLMLTQDTPTNFLTYLRPNDAGGAISIVINRLSPGAGVTHTFGALQSSAGGFTLHVAAGSNITSGSAGFILPSATLGGNATFDVVNSALATTTMTIPGVVSGSGFSLTKTGSGTLVLSGTNTYSGGTAVSGGALDVNGLITGPTTVIAGGTLQGSGIANGLITVMSGGAVAPGNSPGALTVASATFNAGSLLKIELGGTAPATQFDQLKANGPLALGGSLQVSLLNGFAPQLGQSFDILDWGSRTGTFSAIQLPALSTGLAWNATKLYTAGLLSVVDLNHVPGDFDRDHTVSSADINSMLVALTDLNTYKTTNGLSDADLLAIGDLNGDGSFNNADIQGLLDLVANPIGIGSISAVPEPASFWLLIAGGLLLMPRQRRHIGPEAN